MKRCALFFALFSLLPNTVLAQSEPSAPSEKADSKSDINTITQNEVYNPVIALAPEIDKCYKKAHYDPHQSDGVKGSNSIKINIDYDEYGVIYVVDSRTFYDGGGQYGEMFIKMDTCVKNALPPKFNIDFSEMVKTYPENVQKFGWFELVFNIVSKEITIKNPSPVGTPFTDNHRWYKIHYQKYDRYKDKRDKEQNSQKQTDKEKK